MLALDAVTQVRVCALEAKAQLEALTTRSNACILGTRLFVVGARERGVLCRAVPFNVMALNREAYELVVAGVPRRDWPDTAWSVGVMGDAPADVLTTRHGGYSWHLAAEAVIDGRRFLVDMTADQFDRPLRGLSVPAPLVMPLDEDWMDRDALTFSNDDTVLIYRPVGADEESGSVPGQKPGDYKQAPDWVETP